MIYIDLPADLNLEDDQGRNVARLAEAVTPETITPGAVLVAGAPRAWSWAVVEAVEAGLVHFRQVSAREAARHGSLVAPLPASA
jgi:flavin reductase (DIM6/NTAB) family NADH-FMN oxidoreductase RutF